MKMPHTAIDQKPVLSRAPPTPCYMPRCRGPLLHTLIASAWYASSLQKSACRKPGNCFTRLGRTMGAQASYKPSASDALPYSSTGHANLLLICEHTNSLQNWVVLTECNLNYYVGESLLLTIYAHYGNLIHAP